MTGPCRPSRHPEYRIRHDSAAWQVRESRNLRYFRKLQNPRFIEVGKYATALPEPWRLRRQSARCGDAYSG